MIRRFLLLLILIFIVSGCQSDSDYLLGTYSVLTTVQTSTCEENYSSLLTASILPTGFVPDHTALRQWKMTRVAITDAGAEKIHLLMSATGVSHARLLLSGTLDQAFLRIMEHKDIQTQDTIVYRTILLSGHVEQDRIFGQIDTFLSGSPENIDLAYLPAPETPCQITERFVGILLFRE